MSRVSLLRNYTETILITKISYKREKRILKINEFAAHQGFSAEQSTLSKGWQPLMEWAPETEQGKYPLVIRDKILKIITIDHSPL